LTFSFFNVCFVYNFSKRKLGGTRKAMRVEVNKILLSMKKLKFLIPVVLLVSTILIGCGSKVTVCQCLKDDGSHKVECDKLGNKMSSSEMNREMGKCK
jgi:hypothetical protein